MATSVATGFDYPALLRASLIGLVRGLIERVAEDGFPGDHHFLLTFGTDEPGVEMSARLKKRFPEEITVVLQHQFWNLTTNDEGFKVTLRFGGQPEPLAVPWSALRGFADPSCEFGLRLQTPPADAEGVSETEEAGEAGPTEVTDTPDATAPTAADDAAEAAPRESGNVLAFSARKRNQEDKT